MSDSVVTTVMPPATWGTQAVRVLIERKQTIEDRLREQQRWEDFAAEINRWRANYLDGKPFVATATAQALFGICQSFGLLDLIGRGQGPTLPTLGRTLGVAAGPAFGLGGMRSTASESGPNLEVAMRELARLFG